MKTPLTSLALAALLSIGAASANAAGEYGVSVRMFGWALDTEGYAFAYPAFRVTNLSSPGVQITSLTVNDGWGGGLWDYVSNESASSGVAYTLTQGDYTNDSGWSSSVAYSFTGLSAGQFMQFYVDPDTHHAGSGNVVDARPFVLTSGTVTAQFSNGQTMVLPWNNPAAQSFSTLPRIDLPATDARNIYYEVSAVMVPEPTSVALMLAGLGLIGARLRQRASLAPRCR